MNHNIINTIVDYYYFNRWNKYIKSLNKEYSTRVTSVFANKNYHFIIYDNERVIGNTSSITEPELVKMLNDMKVFEYRTCCESESCGVFIVK